MTSRKILLPIYIALLASPFFVSAQTIGNLPPLPTINSIDLCSMILLLEQVVWVIFTAIATISFVGSGILFLTSQGNAEKVAAARGSVIWGIIGIAVGILAYSIIGIVGSSLGSTASC